LRLEVADNEARALDDPERGERADDIERVIEESPVVGYSGEALHLKEVIAQHVVPQAVNLAILGEESMASNVEAEPIVAFRPSDATHLVRLLQKNGAYTPLDKLVGSGQTRGSSPDHDD